MQYDHEYEITFQNGDRVIVRTNEHHDDYDNVEKFAKAHDSTIKSALGVASLIYQGLSLRYLKGRGR